MNPFPPTAELQFLVGTELREVCLGLWQVHLRFDVGHINVEAPLEHIDGAGIVRRHNTDADRLSPILMQCLLGQKVQMILVEPFCLTLGFEQGDLLRIFSDDGQYECGQIYDEAGLVSVF